MRITYKMMTSKYSTNLNNLSKELDKLNTQVASGRKFSKTSEDTSSAVRAYQLRKNMSKVEGYQSNIGHAQDFLTNTETTVGQIEDSLAEATDKILQGMNGTQSSEERTIIAKELRKIQEQMLQSFNTSSADTYIFGGSNTGEKPFTVDASGKLLYNNVDVDTMDDAQYKTLSEDALFVDIGLGLSFDSGTGEVDRNTVFNYSVPGIKFAGHGTATVAGITGDVSKNVYNLLGKIADEFEASSYNFNTVDNLYGHFKSMSQLSYQTTTELGSKTNYLDFMTDRYETQDFNMQTRQTEVEGVDAAYTYIAFQTQKVAYQAALQMGSNIVQQSVFDYLT